MNMNADDDLGYGGAERATGQLREKFCSQFALRKAVPTGAGRPPLIGYRVRFAGFRGRKQDLEVRDNHLLNLNDTDFARDPKLALSVGIEMTGKYDDDCIAHRLHAINFLWHDTVDLDYLLEDPKGLHLEEQLFRQVRCMLLKAHLEERGEPDAVPYLSLDSIREECVVDKPAMLSMLRRTQKLLMDFTESGRSAGEQNLEFDTAEGTVKGIAGLCRPERFGVEEERRRKASPSPSQYEGLDPELPHWYDYELRKPTPSVCLMHAEVPVASQVPHIVEV